MKFTLIILFIFSQSQGESKKFELRLPQENEAECLKTSEEVKLSINLPGISFKIQSSCEPTDSDESEESDSLST